MAGEVANRPRKRLGTLAGVALSLGLAYVAGCTALVLFQDQLIFPRHNARAQLLPPPDKRVVVGKLPIPEGGEVESWFLPAPGATAERPSPAVIFCHGNAELIDHQGYYVGKYHAMGVSVLLPEYRGYGRSAGKPSQMAIREDMIRFYDQLVERPEVDRTRVLFHGVSLGGAVVCDLAGQRVPKAMVLQSTLANMEAFAHRYLVPGFMLRHPFHSDDVVVKLDIPLLIFHGSRDEVIPVWHGRKLAALARNGKYVEYDCGHNDWPGVGNETAYWTEIRQFLSKADITDGPAF